MGKIHSGGEVSLWIVLPFNNNNNNDYYYYYYNGDDDNNNNNNTYIRQTKKSKFI